MRYLYLAALLTLIVLAATALEAMHSAPGTTIQFIQESGLGPHLLAALLLGILIAFGFPRRAADFARRYQGSVARAAHGFLAMFVLGIAILVLLTALLAVLGQADWGQGTFGSHSNALALTVASAIALACAVAIAEEVFFRGFLVSFLRWNTSRVVTIGAVVSSALLYALAHELQNPVAWLSLESLPLLVGLFLLGVLLAVTYVVTRSLWCPIGLHAALVAFDLAVLKAGVVRLDLSRWWLGNTDDVREAPLVWMTWIAVALLLMVFRKKLQRRFAIEDAFVGSLLSPDDGISASKVGERPILPHFFERPHRSNIRHSKIAG